MKMGKQIGRTAVTSAALMMLCVVGASATNLGVGTVNADGLRLRAEASTSSTILNTAYTGERVIVLEDAGNNWYKVDYKTVEGYMYADYLDVATKLDADLGYGRVEVSSTLNVRSGPSTDYDKLGFLSDDAVVRLTGMQDGWYHISYGNGESGYVSSEYVKTCLDSDGSRGDEAGADNSSLQAQIVAYAKQFVGVPYVYGGNGPKTFDCSGFTKYVYAHFGYNINRTASYQLDNGVSVSKDQLQPGDLVFFRRPNEDPKFRASHVGIYLGNDQFINASSNTMSVIIETLSKKKNYIGARRIL